MLRKTNSLVIYIDESEINEKIEASTIASHRTIRVYLESNTTFTIYLAELYEIILALILTHIFEHDKTHVIICTNN